MFFTQVFGDAPASRLGQTGVPYLYTNFDGRVGGVVPLFSQRPVFCSFKEEAVGAGNYTGSKRPNFV
jgi:hypothetical protein